ncbi:MAG TPA: glycosyltransferase family 2 protein [Pyrinomonadaceae bacterium]
MIHTEAVAITAVVWLQLAAFSIYVYYLLAAIAIWLGVQSVLGGFRFSSYVRHEYSQPLTSFTPYASVIAPCRGVDLGLKENLESLFTQDYPHYEIVFVTDATTDASVRVIEEVRQKHALKPLKTNLVFAGQAVHSGQKVHNLREAVLHTDSASEVLVFVDADARPAKNWLRSLVAPLQDQKVGAATGYRWFLSQRGNLASQLLSVWNASIASALGGQGEKNFCWGGSTAIRRITFEGLRVRERWLGTVSDDFTLMRVLREAHLPIKFVPACLTASLENYNFRQLLEFTTRQLQITRVYAPQFWKAALVGGVIFNTVFFGGLVLLMVRIIFGSPILALLIPLATIFILGAVKAFVRWRAVSIPLASYSKELRSSFFAHIFLWPLGALLFLYNAIIAAFSRRIVWKDITYELKSPTEAVIISRDRRSRRL